MKKITVLGALVVFLLQVNAVFPYPTLAELQAFFDDMVNTEILLANTFVDGNLTQYYFHKTVHFAGKAHRNGQ